MKLDMEGALRDCVRGLGAAAVVGRLSNLYGPGQDLNKPQGVVSRLCLTHLTGEPFPVYVSLDTRRDYLYVADAAAMVAAGLAEVRDRVRSSGDRVLLKVVASGRSTTLAAMVGESNRVFHRRAPLRVVSTSAPGQVRDLRLRSVVWPELQRHVRTPLPAGLQRTADDVAHRVFKGEAAARLAEGGVRR